MLAWSNTVELMDSGDPSVFGWLIVFAVGLIGFFWLYDLVMGKDES